MLLTAFNAHRNGAKIHRAGAKLAELHAATAYELHPGQEKREAVIMFS